MIRIAVPKARLWTQSATLLRHLGFVGTLDERRFRHLASSEIGPIEAFALKLPDIAEVVGDGLVDYAIVSDEWLAETDAEVQSLLPMCWYHARICVLSPRGPARIAPSATTIATTFPRIAARWSPDATVRHVSGSIEAFPGRLTDLAVDCVETGDTAMRNGLVIGEELLRCDVRLVAANQVALDGDVHRYIMAASELSSQDPKCTFGDTSHLRLAS